jgi:hypothetical protein
MIVFVFGNPDLAMDSLPLRLLPEMRRRLPGVYFQVKDPNEEWDVPEDLIIVDTVVGITEPRLFLNLDDFADAPRLSMHDFDAFANLRLLQKIGRLKTVRVIGLPPDLGESAAADFIESELRPMTSQNSK